MDNKLKEEVFRLHAEICGALADPNRILLLYTLSTGARNVNELVAIVNLPQPTVSRHLRTLRERGMVIARRSGQAVYYDLVDTRIIQALDLLRAALADRLENQAALVHTIGENSTSDDESVDSEVLIQR